MSGKLIRHRVRGQIAFSLTELLVVIAIIGIAAVFAVPAFNSIARSTALAGAANSISDELLFARQTAMSRGRPVEVRFYEVPGDQAPHGRPSYIAAQSFIWEEGATVPKPLRRVRTLPNSVELLDQPEFSTVLAESTSDVSGEDSIAGYSGPVRYIGFQFFSDGSADLDINGAGGGEPWTLTLSHATPEVVDASGLDNFVTFVIDPVSGRLESFRP